MPQPSTKGVVSLAVDSPVELADVEILHDGMQVLSLHCQKVSLTPPLRWEGLIPLDRRGRLDWGAYALRAVTADGRMATSRPIFVERPVEAECTLGLWTFDDDKDREVLDSSPWLHDGRLGGRERQDDLVPATGAGPLGWTMSSLRRRGRPGVARWTDCASQRLYRRVLGQAGFAHRSGSQGPGHFCHGQRSAGVGTTAQRGPVADAA